MPPWQGHGTDPFNTVTAMVGRTLLEVHHLQSSALAGDAAAARRLPALLGALDKQVAALEAAADAMSRAPARFGLSAGAARGRRAEVDELRQCAAGAARACGLGGGGGGGAGLDGVEYQQRVVHLTASVKAGIYYQRQLADKAVGYRAVERNTRRTASARGLAPDAPPGGGGGCGGGGGDADGAECGPQGGDGADAAGESAGELERYVRRQMEREDGGACCGGGACSGGGGGCGKDAGRGPAIIDIEPEMGADFCAGPQPPAAAVPTSRGDLHLLECGGGGCPKKRGGRCGEALAAARADRQLQAILALSLTLAALVIVMIAAPPAS